jgi:uncharacterized protein
MAPIRAAPTESALNSSLRIAASMAGSLLEALSTGRSAAPGSGTCPLAHGRPGATQGDVMATSAEWHEDYEKMTEAARNFSRAIKSVQEELEAVDWYNQRAEATQDAQLRRILEHNRDEEIEHAIMGLEYLRRVNKTFDAHMRTYLFSEGDILEVEEKATGKKDKD